MGSGISRYFNNNLHKNHRIALYATASTPSAAYIIGGVIRKVGDSTDDYAKRTTSRIMVYRNDEWHHFGKLNSFRRRLSSISYGDDTMVIGGGKPDGERLAGTDFTILELQFRVSNEVWDFRTITSRTMISFESKEYLYPVLFLVDPKFCVQEIYPTPVSFPTATNWGTFTNSYVPTNYPTTSYQSSP